MNFTLDIKFDFVEEFIESIVDGTLKKNNPDLGAGELLSCAIDMSLEENQLMEVCKFCKFGFVNLSSQHQMAIRKNSNYRNVDVFLNAIDEHYHDLHDAIENSDHDKVLNLLNQGASPSDDPMLIMNAIDKKNIPIIQSLFKFDSGKFINYSYALNLSLLHQDWLFTKSILDVAELKVPAAILENKQGLISEEMMVNFLNYGTDDLTSTELNEIVNRVAKCGYIQAFIVIQKKYPHLVLERSFLESAVESCSLDLVNLLLQHVPLSDNILKAAVSSDSIEIFTTVLDAVPTDYQFNEHLLGKLLEISLKKSNRVIPTTLIKLGATLDNVAYYQDYFQLSFLANVSNWELLLNSNLVTPLILAKALEITVRDNRHIDVCIQIVNDVINTALLDDSLVIIQQNTKYTEEAHDVLLSIISAASLSHTIEPSTAIHEKFDNSSDCLKAVEVTTHNSI
ncbi:MAG: hypothetical protein HAW67_03345 [Endozoicomonadaceae bacterium]|nr:hypothetical protein [Endozoicomonadaceae bacterium]